MKMRTAEKVHYDSGPNMTPLVDVVMVILIFLMLTGSFAVGEHFLQSNMPVTAKGSGQVNDKSVPDEPLDIRVDSYTRPGPDGVSVDMWSAQAGGFMIQNHPEQLVSQLTKMREALNNNNQPTDKIQVIINPARQTKYRHLIDVYEAALQAGFKKVSFSHAH
jgi:biopolymer transport protein ExbD